MQCFIYKVSYKIILLLSDTNFKGTYASALQSFYDSHVNFSVVLGKPHHPIAPVPLIPLRNDNASTYYCD